MSTRMTRRDFVRTAALTAGACENSGKSGSAALFLRGARLPPGKMSAPFLVPKSLLTARLLKPNCEKPL